jgi:hypothetical protein
MKKLPYRARTATGDTFDIEFPLHSETGDPVKVGQLISVLLEAIDSEMTVTGETSNGDVLQAVAMTLAIRGGMIRAPLEPSASLASDLVRTAFDAMAEATIHRAQSGRA